MKNVNSLSQKLLVINLIYMTQSEIEYGASKKIKTPNSQISSLVFYPLFLILLLS